MLQLPHRDYVRHMMLPLSSAGSASLVTRHAVMQVLRPIPGGRSSSAGGVQLILSLLCDLGEVFSCTGAALGTWLSAGRGTGELGRRAAYRGMCGRLRKEILGRSINPASYSIHIYQLLS